MTPFPPQICLHLVLKSSPSWQVLLGDPPPLTDPKSCLSSLSSAYCFYVDSLTHPVLSLTSL